MTETSSAQDFKNRVLLRTDDHQLVGCVAQNGNVAKVELTSFQITIKPLDVVEQEFSHSYRTSEWQTLLSYLQRKSLALSDGTP